jgi:hypothetical protein
VDSLDFKESQVLSLVERKKYIENKRSLLKSDTESNGLYYDIRQITRTDGFAVQVYSWHYPPGHPGEKIVYYKLFVNFPARTVEAEDSMSRRP